MFLCALVIFGMVLVIFSGIYENCLRAEKDFRGHLGSWESTLIFAVESLYILFLLVLFWLICEHLGLSHFDLLSLLFSFFEISPFFFSFGNKGF